ncbi:MAG: hypothetical protein AAGJ79_00455 [Verrucomicrobiota bacterium]
MTTSGNTPEEKFDSLQSQIDSLLARVSALESEVEHEHEDLERLKEEHRTAATVPPPTAAPVGL